MRAVAVLVVIAYHAGLPLPGGFVGVDVFFVISGFVITAMLLREWRAVGRVNIGAFYLRRFRRLTPALAVVVMLTLLASLLILSPFDRQLTTAKTAMGAMALVANAVIARTSGNYFAGPADLNPLLHTWSLSVEEQFYLVFPAVLVTSLTVGRRRRSLTVAVVVFGCLALASLALVRGPSIGIPADSWWIGFYSPLVRGWEFLAGALIALVAPALEWLRRPAVGTALGALGLGLLLAALVFIDSSTPFPGKVTILPVSGAAALIVAGFASNPVSRLLGSAPMARIGDWSYSLYLWHWPFIVFALALWPLTPHVAPLAAVACIAPALASYYWVEQPLRSPRGPNWRSAARLVGAFVGAPLVFAGSAWFIASMVLAPAFATPATQAASSTLRNPQQREVPEDFGVPCEQPAIATVVGDNGVCRQSAPGADIEVALLGDSHAEHLLPGFLTEFPDVGIGAYTVRSGYLMATPEGLSRTLAALEDMPHLRVVVLSRFWDRGTQTQDMVDSYRLAVERLTARGTRVLVTDDVPSYPFDQFSCQHQRFAVGGKRLCTQPLARFRADRATYMPMLEGETREHDLATITATARYFCDENECSMAPEGDVLYRDRDHLTAYGSRWLLQRLVAADPDFVQVIRGGEDAAARR